ncbi:MAG: hypothetical protein WCF18_05625 [Chthoniobacteraceae bacterium]
MKKFLHLVLLLSAASLSQSAEPSVSPPIAVEHSSSEKLSKEELAGFRARLLATTTRHLDLLLKPDGKVADLRGKSGDGMTALAFQLVYEMTGNEKYRSAALELANRVVTAMRATKHGVLFIKEKEKGSGETIDGGGPPAFGWYVSAAAYILRKEKGRQDDLRYLATVADNFAWNDGGWWANSVDINTGEPKEPITKEGAVNKNAGMALAAGILSVCVQEFDPALAARLSAKVDKCVDGQIIPKQEPDGFWHYGLKGNDPNNKDVLGYFMVTVDALTKLKHFAPSARQSARDQALEKAYTFAAEQIAPMTDPNHGTGSVHLTRSTPKHYELFEDPKRGFALGLILIAGGHQREAMKIVDHWMKNFPLGDTKQDGAKAVDAFAHMLLLLPQEPGKL